MSEKIRIFFEFRVPLITYFLIFIALVIMHFTDIEFHNFNSITSQIGGLVLFGGFGIRILATSTKKYLGKIKITGIYALCRQPLLLSQIFVIAGLNMLVRNLFFLAFSIILLIVNDFLCARKYDKVLSRYYRDVWKIYAKHTNFIVPFTKRVKDVFTKTISTAEVEKSNNIYLFAVIYIILVEISVFAVI